MYVTLHLVDGRKITKDMDRLTFFAPSIMAQFQNMPPVNDGYITVNLESVVDMRPAEEDEIEHAKIHGW